MKLWTRKAPPSIAAPAFPGIAEALDGSAAVVAMETAASEGAGAYPITPSTQMGEGWAAAVAEGKQNVNGRRLLFFEPEGEHAAAAVTAGMSMTGLRATNFSSGQGIAYMHESLYAAVGKRLTYVLNVAARAMTKHALNVHAGHDDYHAVDDTGFFQMFAKDVQESADLNLIAHRIAELSLNPGIIAQDGFLTSHVIESIKLPEPELVRVYLGDPADMIDAPTPAQRLVFGPRRRRIPELFDVDHPAMVGVVQNQESYAQGVAAQRPFYFDHIADLADRAFGEYADLTGRAYARATGYRLADAEWVIAGQGSVVSNAEAVADHLRERGLRVGVLNLTMFRPFPADLVTRLLAGKRGVVVLERTDQPLAVDAPLMRELRAACMQAMENGRVPAEQSRPHTLLPSLQPFEVPDFYSGCFGLGSRDLQPNDIIAAVENMLPRAAGRRQFYLGIDFVRPNTRLPKLQIWQEQLLEAYPELANMSLAPAAPVNLLPPESVSLRIHSVGGWGAITMGKNVAFTVFELFGLQIKANPKYGSEKKGQPTTFYATFAPEPIRLNCELRHVDVVLSPDPNVFRHSNPLAGLAEGGAFVIQSDLSPEAFWATIPGWARREIVSRRISVHLLDAFAIAAAEASGGDLRYRMQGTAFMGAFFAVSPLMRQRGVSEEQLFTGMAAQLSKKFKRFGQQVVDDNLRVIRRGFTEFRTLDVSALPVLPDEPGVVPVIPELLDVADAEDGVTNGGRFWEQVCFINKTGQDTIADPFAATAVIPAVTSVVRDMTDVRLEVPKFIAEKCTGCAQCWTQCPDSAIPGLVTEVDQLLETGIAIAASGGSLDRMRQVSKHLTRETRRLVNAGPVASFGQTLDTAYETVAGKLGWEPDRRAALDAEFAKVKSVIADFPVARTAPFWTGPEGKQAGTGGLLSITVNPEACKGCNLCVDVCPDGALVTVKQEPEVVDELRRNWAVWQKLPDTPDRFINVSNVDEGIGVLSSLLLKKANYRSMVGGDGACMGCGEKTAVHLIVSAIHASVLPKVKHHVEHLDGLIASLEERSRDVLAASADLSQVEKANGSVKVPVTAENKALLQRLTAAKTALEDLRWRYLTGPGGRGRSAMGMANSTGCSSVWGSTYPYNPYPFPWTNHLFQDSPSLAIGLFEGHMRKMADGFITVRRAEQLLAGTWNADTETELAQLDWQHFTDEEFALCPPIFSMGGDGAMLDIGFQNLSRLMASGKPLRVIVLDTQVYSNTGGQACTSGFTGQVSDMAAYGAAMKGKRETRKELAFIALAHRGVYVHQSSQASPAHLLSGVLRGLKQRRPVLINVYTPCPVEHGLADNWAMHAARFALESRAFPFLTYDPQAGDTFADCLSLEGNPALDDRWPTYTLEYVDAAGAAQTLELPLTTADWAFTEGRFRKHFKRVAKDVSPDALVPFHEFVALAPDDRAGKTPYIRVLDEARHIELQAVSLEIVTLAEERLQFWSQLRQLAGLEVATTVRDRITDALEAELTQKMDALRADYERRITDLKVQYPLQIAKRMADVLLRQGDGKATVAELLTAAKNAPPVDFSSVGAAMVTPTPPQASPSPAAAVQKQVPAEPQPASSGAATAAVTATATAVADDDMAMEAYIESARCTTCNECTNSNSRMFGYNGDRQAYVKDAHAGTFQQLVLAAERCPVGIIHPGTPLNPKEKDLEKWIKRAQPFN